jgi:hypothetical protein
MEKLKAFTQYLDGKKRGIAALAGTVLTWAATYDAVPERYLVLAASALSIWTGLAVGHAVVKKPKT